LSHLKGNFNVKDFESACGVGITVSPEEIERVVENLIKKHRDELLDKRYTEITTEYRISSLQFTYHKYCICSCILIELVMCIINYSGFTLNTFFPIYIYIYIYICPLILLKFGDPFFFFNFFRSDICVLHCLHLRFFRVQCSEEHKM